MGIYLFTFIRNCWQTLYRPFKYIIFTFNSHALTSIIFISFFQYPIKNKLLLAQACCALVFVIICFFIQSVPQWRTLPLGWVALLGVIALLIILNREDMEHLMHRIEWTTLLFFAAMFVMMECVERLGLFAWIGEVTEHVILYVDKKNRLAMAIFIILWMSALASAILDSIPVTAMMVKVVVSLVAKETLGLPLEPLVWALAFGPCLGGEYNYFILLSQKMKLVIRNVL